jgi:SAM-dependent methyltransferase
MDSSDGAPVPDEDHPSCCFDDWSAHNSRRARSKETVTRVTTAMVGTLAERGLDGSSVLDVGCGTGDLVLALLARGASSGTGMDLGAGGVSNAQELAVSRGLADRVRFLVGDGAEAALEPADIVTLNRVVCCYPHVDGLIGNATGAARSVFAFSAPVDRGLVGGLNRAATWVWNRWYALRDTKYRGFRVFIHDLDAVERAVSAAGFERIRDQRVRWGWRLQVFQRT